MRHDWFRICGEIARRCHKNGRIVIPKTQGALYEPMLKWCEEQGLEEPPRTDLLEAIRQVLAALRNV